MKALFKGPLAWFTSLNICLLLCVLILLTLNRVYPLNVPVGQQHFSKVVLAEDGRVLRAFPDKKGIWRQQVTIEQVSPLYLEALLNYEDRRFWSHQGVDPLALLRALWQNLVCGCVVSGGSTITMQVARILHPHPRSLFGKFQQILRSVQLEWQLSKSDILTLYLNFAPFGGTLEGVAAASHGYLGKPPNHLSHAEAALLAVLPQRPSWQRPDKHPQRAQRARDKVLDRMAKWQVWSPESVARAKQEQVYAERPRKPKLAPLLARKLANQQATAATIQTTIDFNLQQALETRLAQFIAGQASKSSAAVLVVDNRTQQVKAYLGSADFNNNQRFGHVDMVQAIRSPGSTLKPFIYGMAIDKGLVHSHSLLSDSPRTGEDYQPENFTSTFSGPVSLADALKQSLNLPAVQVLSELGARSFYHRLQNSGITLSLPEHAQANLSIALGGAGTSLWQLVMAYTSLTNQGRVFEPHILLGKAPQSGKRLFDPESAWIIYKILSENTSLLSVNSENIAQSLPQFAWKTGTSYGFRDAWAIGSSRDYTLGVWLGRPDGTPSPGQYGALNAAPLLKNIADMLHRQGYAGIAQPEQVKQTEICWPLGRAAISTPLQHCHQRHTAWLANGRVPGTFTDSEARQWAINPLPVWLDNQTGERVNWTCHQVDKTPSRIALWPKQLEPWLDKKHRRRQLIPTWSKNCEQDDPLVFNDLRIQGLNDQSKVYLLSTRQKPLHSLTTLGGTGFRDWYVNGQHKQRLTGEQAFFLSFSMPGKKQIVVVDEAGSTAQIELEVIQRL